MFLLPLRAEVEFERAPVANYALIFVNVLVFVVVQQAGSSVPDLGMLHSDSNFRIWQFITSQFLHGSWMHLLFNMLFLWIFGNTINAYFGNSKYLVAYLSMGIIAGMAHVTTSPVPVLGASGSIMGVAGLFAFFYPTATIRCLIWVAFFIRLIDARAFWVVVYFIFWDVLYIVLGANTGTAHWAHFGGFLAGIGGGILIYQTGIVERTHYDCVAWFTGGRNRREREALSGLYPTLEDRNARPYPNTPFPNLPDVPNPAREIAPSASRSEPTAADALHAAIQGGHPDVGREFLRLLEENPKVVFPEATEAALFDRLVRTVALDLAVREAERYLGAYPTGSDAARIAIEAATIHIDRLRTPDAARPFLEHAVRVAQDPFLRSRANALLARI
jgi:membrane associated rhomboid family serine protease